MSPPAVEIESPVEKISSFLNPTENLSALFPESVHSPDQRTMYPSFSFGFEAGSGQRTKSRQNPRLVKLRKNGRKGKEPSFSGEILSGFNPFAPPSKGMNSENDRNDYESPVDKFFVFGANGKSSGAKNSAGNATVSSLSDEEFSTPIGDSELSSEYTKEHSDGAVGKVDNDNRENIRPCSESTTCDAKYGVRFGGGENGSWKSVENPDAVKDNFLRQGDINKTSCYNTCSKSSHVQFADGKTVDHRDGPEELNLPADMEKLNINDIDTRVHGGSDYEEASKSNSTPVFIFGSSGKVDPKCKEGVATSEPCSFSSNGFHQSNNAANENPTFHSKTTNVNNLTNTTFGTKTSFDDFKVPEWDPSLLKNSLFPEGSRNSVHARRNRSSKDKRSKKVKEKNETA